MTRRILLLLVLLGIGLPASAQKVYIDYDREYDRSEVKTFRWKKTDDTSLAEVSPFLHSQIVNGIEYYLHQGGLHEVEADPDVFVTYHTSSKEEMSINTDHYGYGYGGGWYGHGCGCHRDLRPRGRALQPPAVRPGGRALRRGTAGNGQHGRGHDPCRGVSHA